MPSTAKLWETDTSHTLVAVQDGPSPLEKGAGISGQTMCAFSLEPSHPTSRNPLEIRKLHLHEVMHCWGTLLKVDHDSQHKYNTSDSSIKTEAYFKIIYKIMKLMYLSR